ncbi:IS110 family transposase [Kribbella sp. NBC_00359]|uniref:IS110 family transposase n=1 Tax=Kribbella sp. NBC_00359 TaxID=2975966 RepID=UPI002E1F7876
MVMIGTDSHKRTHTVVAVDDVGRRLGVKTVRTNSEGHLELVCWSAQFDDVTFVLEGCRHLTRRLEADLLAAGCRVVRVPPRLMAGARRSDRQPGKSDPIDAEAVAVAALRHPGLPVAALDGSAREVKLLSDHRHDLVVQRTRIASQIRWYLHELDPDLQIPSRGLKRHCVVAELLAELDRFDGVVDDTAMQPGKLPAQVAFDVVTRAGAEAIGRGDDLGSIEPGKQGDMVVFDTTHTTWTPPGDDPYLQLVWGTDGRSVRDVIVAGSRPVHSP